MKLLETSKRTTFKDEIPSLGFVERIFGEQDDDNVIVNRSKFSVRIEVQGNNDLYIKKMRNGMFHSNHGPAVFMITDEGSENEEYYLDFGQFTREEWLERRDRLTEEPFDDMIEEILSEMGL
jgi:hypothetical protein